MNKYTITFFLIIMKANKAFKENDKGVVGVLATIAVGLAVLVLSIIIVAVFYPIAASVDTTSIDAEFSGTPSANATDSVLDVAATVFELNPLVALVAIASAIITLVMGMVYIGGGRGGGL